MTNVGFVHLHVHSSYSLLEGAMKVADIVEMAVADGQPAVALTDTNNLFGALEFSEKAAGKGVQPIQGMQVAVAFDKPEVTAKAMVWTTYPIVLLAKNETGYQNLLKLSTALHFGPELGEAPRLSMADLRAHKDGLICLSGGYNGPVDTALRAGDESAARGVIGMLGDLFGADDFFIEIQRTGMPGQNAVEPKLVELADAFMISLVATAEPFFGKIEDHEAHDALLAMSGETTVSEKDRRRVTARHAFVTREQMIALFADLPDALASTVDIAQRCAYRALTRKPILPSFADGDEAGELRRQAEEGLAARLEHHGPYTGFTEQAYWDRLDYELSVIERMGFPGYFLIVSDFIKWAKAHDIPVGPGRGSGAGSLVAYSLVITDIDPLRFGLLFERFLNPERVSMPDFDIDFCIDGRERVIDYVRNRYGHEQVAQIITFGTMLARSVMKSVGRVLEMPNGQVNRLAQLVPNNPAKPTKLADAIAGEPKLQSAIEEEEGVQRLMDLSQRLEGLHSHASTHAAGVVIGDRPLDQLVPLYRDPESGSRVTQFNMKWVEPAGLVKFDFLGLKTLTVIRRAIDLIAKRGITVDLASLPLDDGPTYEMMRKAEVTGVFQVESAGMRRALVEMQVDRIEDIIALVALYRPGPMANIPVYCQRKLGTSDEPVSTWYPHPAVSSVLSETFGIIVYQEQVMEVAKVLAGYSLGDADLLRRAMGKKIKAEMDAQRGRFVKGCVERGLTFDLATEIFDLLAKFADYGFNKSHAAAYALISYQTAYLKANFPVEFLAAAMTMESGDTDKLAEFRAEAKRLGIEVEPPSINRGGTTFEVHDGKIRYALAAIKGVGVPAVEAVMAARGAAGFSDLADFANKVDPKLVNKRVVERLVDAGAFDEIDTDRARVSAAIPSMNSVAKRAAAGRAKVGDLFGELAAQRIEIEVPTYYEWPLSERLQREYDAIGSFLSGHPLDEFGDFLEKLRFLDRLQLLDAVRDGAKRGQMAAIVVDRQEKRSRAGNKFGIITLSDKTGQYEALVFSDTFEELRDLFETGRAVSVQLEAELDGDELKARIRSAAPLEEALTAAIETVSITVHDESAFVAIGEHLRRPGRVSVKIAMEGADIALTLPSTFAVDPAIIAELQAVPGVANMEMAC
jgi:DNA polymerase-3 subunit alpha